MHRKCPHLSAPVALALVACLALLTACSILSNGGAGPDIPASQTVSPTGEVVLPSPAPTSTPLPEPALDPELVWVAVDGMGDALMTVAPDGAAEKVRLPLNEGQRASSVVAARDGRFLAYLVWDAEGHQHGVATWDLTEVNARLVMRPLPGYRIIALYLADDSSALVTVQVAEDQPLEEADWRLDRTPARGGEPTLLASRDMLDDVPPLVPFAWPVGGPILLNAAIHMNLSRGIYAVNPDVGGGRLVIPLDEQIVVSPALSSDDTRLAYLTYDSSAPGASTGDIHTVNVVRVHNLRLDQTVTVAAPEGQSIYGMRWHPDGVRLLLDMVTRSADGSQGEQFWALVAPDQPPPWTQTTPGPGRENLFDYEPYGAGVIYTVLPLDGVWELYVLPDLLSDSPPQVVSLEPLAQEYGAPVIIRTP